MAQFTQDGVIYEELPNGQVRVVGYADAGPPGIQVKPADPNRGLEAGIKQAQLEKLRNDLATQGKPTLPQGFRWKGGVVGGEAERIPGIDPNAGSTKLSAKERADAIAGFKSAEQLDGIIRDLETKFQEGPGATKGIKGLRDYNPWNADNQNFDNAGNAARGIVGQALGFTGGQLNTATEAAMAVGPYLPQANDRDEVILSKIARLKELAKTARERSVAQLGGVPDANGNITPVQQQRSVPALKAPDMGLATGTQKFEPSETASKLATELARNGMSDEQINQALTAGGFSTLTPQSIGQVREFLKQNPSYKGVVPGAGTYAPTTAFNRFAASPMGAGAASYMDAASAGLTSQIIGQEGRDALQQLQENNQVPALIGGGLGGLTALSGAGALLRGTRLAQMAAGAPIRAALAGDMAYGGTFGYNTADEGDGLTGAAVGAAGSAIGNVAGLGVGNLAGRALRGVRNANLDVLRGRGIPITIGQIAQARGGMLGRLIGGTEEVVANTPGVGALVNPRRAEGLAAYNRAEFADAGAPIGFAPTEIGREGVQQLADARSQAYMNALNPARIDTTDPLFAADVTAAQAAAQAIPNVQPTLPSDYAQGALANRIPNGAPMTGRDFQESYRGLSRDARARTNSDYGHEIGAATRLGQDALAGALERQNPGAYQGFLAANASNRNLNVVADAVGRAQNAEDMMFTPAQMATARRMADQRLGGRIDAATRPLRTGTGLTDAAQAVLPNRTPPTGVNAAPLLALLGGATYAGGEASDSDTLKTLSLLGLAAAPYTRTGRNIAQSALLDRPQLLQDIGTFTVDRIAPRIGMFGRGLGAGATGLIAGN